jgi:hypothetical protein
MNQPNPRPSNSQYDAIIIGCGMSGLGAALRLRLFGKKVVIVEAHKISGGLNSYYKRQGREFDVGLHALTNFSAPNPLTGRVNRKTPLGKLLQQLNLNFEDFRPREIFQSRIHFPQRQITFTNEIGHLIDQIERFFPEEKAGFLELIKVMGDQGASLSLSKREFLSARMMLSQWIKDQTLQELILCPLLFYGSATPQDMDWPQFGVMFNAIYLQGLFRPQGGVRTLLNVLLKKYQEELGGEIRFSSPVVKILTDPTSPQVTTGVQLKGGEILNSNLVISSCGSFETQNLLEENAKPLAPNLEFGAPLTFTETILKVPTDFLETLNPPKNGDLKKDTLIFYSKYHQFHYADPGPEKLFDENSAVICFPENFEGEEPALQQIAGQSVSESTVRVTFLASYAGFKALKDLSRQDYLGAKEKVLRASEKLIFNLSQNQNQNQQNFKCHFSDVFTPTTITRYTSHLGGGVYGQSQKLLDGSTSTKGLVLCGTDQGFLGVIGSLLSGISMANLHGLGGGP